MYISTLDLEHQHSNINGFSRILSYPEDAACVLIIRIFLKWYKYRKKTLPSNRFLIFTKQLRSPICIYGKAENKIKIA